MVVSQVREVPPNHSILTILNNRPTVSWGSPFKKPPYVCAHVATNPELGSDHTLSSQRFPTWKTERLWCYPQQLNRRLSIWTTHMVWEFWQLRMFLKVSMLNPEAVLKLKSAIFLSWYIKASNATRLDFGKHNEQIDLGFLSSPVNRRLLLRMGDLQVVFMNGFVQKMVFLPKLVVFVWIMAVIICYYWMLCIVVITISY